MNYFECSGVDRSVLNYPTIAKANGAVAQFKTDLNQNLLHAICNFNATQDLHGYNSPWIGGAGKNIAFFSNDNAEQSQNLETTIIDENNISFVIVGTYARIMFAIPCEVGVQYTVSFNGVCTADYKRVQFRSTNTWGSTDLGTVTMTTTKKNYNITFTTITNKIYVSFYLSSGSSTSGTATINNFMIEKGSTASNFAPYSNICPIVGVDKTNITRTANNIFTSPIERGNINANGENADNLNPNRSRTVKQIAVRQSTEYTVGNAENYQVGIFFYTSNGAFISFLSWDNTPRTFTTPSNCEFVRFAYQNISNTYPTKNQLCKGATLDNYDQTVITKLINFGGTYYGGTVDAITGKITLTHGFVKFDGTQQNNEFAWSRNYEKNRIAWNPFQNVGKIGTKNFVSDKLITAANYNATPDEWVVANSAATVARCFIGVPDTIENVEDWQTYVANNNISLVYELETPIVVFAQNSAEIPTIQGDNNAFCDTGNIDIDYILSVDKYIQNQQ